MLLPLTHNHPLVRALLHVKRELVICSQNVKENIGGIGQRNGVRRCNCPQENYI